MFDYDLTRPQYSPWSQLAILLLLSGTGLLIGGFVSLGIAHAYLNVPLEKLPEALKNSGNATLSRSLQFVSTFFFMAVPSFLYARMMDRHALTYIGFNSLVSRKQLLIIVGIVFIGLMVSGTLSQVNEMIPLTNV